MIAYLQGDGIWVNGATTVGNAILRNSIYSNSLGGTDTGIDLAGGVLTGTHFVTLNDAGDGDTGPNDLQNYPVLTSVSSGVAGTNFVGSLNSNAGTYRVEFFGNRTSVLDGSGYGEGERYLGFTTVTIPGPGSGTTNFNVTLPVWVNSGDRISATATVDLGGGVYRSTSEFAQIVTATGSVLVVDTVSDAVDGTTTSITNLTNNRGADGRISLREAILATNATAGLDLIVFDIPGAGPIFTINVGTSATALNQALPAIVDAVIIDATTQAGFAGSPVVELNGTAVTAGAATTRDGFRLTNAAASDSVLRGFVINRFQSDGVELQSADRVTIAGNWIGVNNAGSAASANGAQGINVASTSINNTIGGTGANDRNVISGNAGNGIQFTAAGSTGNVLLGNYIGLGADGTTRIANGWDGIVLGTMPPRTRSAAPQPVRPT